MTLRVFKITASLLADLLLFVFFMKLVVTSESERFKREVGSVIPDGFPVFVSANDGTDSFIVLHGEMAAFLKSHKDHSYIVPDTNLRSINEYLVLYKDESPTGDTKANSVPYDGPVASVLEVKINADGSQEVKVEGSYDDDHVSIGWYTAREHEYKPHYYQAYFGPGLVIKALGKVFLITTVLYSLAMVLWIRYRNRRKSTYPA